MNGSRYNPAKEPGLKLQTRYFEDEVKAGKDEYTLGSKMVRGLNSFCFPKHLFCNILQMFYFCNQV